MWVVAAWAAEPECPESALLLADDPRIRGSAVIVVWKGERRAAVYREGALVPGACWPVALAPGADPGPKERQGDLRTPEGWYRTSDRPTSRFYHALNVSYPGPADADRGLAAGVITAAQAARIRAAAAAGSAPPSDTGLGGLILLHGGGSSSDWTLGCVGFEDADIDALRALLPADLRTDVLLLR